MPTPKRPQRVYQLEVKYTPDDTANYQGSLHPSLTLLANDVQQACQQAQNYCASKYSGGGTVLVISCELLGTLTEGI